MKIRATYFRIASCFSGLVTAALFSTTACSQPSAPYAPTAPASPPPTTVPAPVINGNIPVVIPPHDTSLSPTDSRPFFDIFSTLPSGAAHESRYLAPTYQLGANVAQRWFRSPRNTLGGGVIGQRRSSPGIFVDRGYGANVAFTREVTSQLPLSATYRFEVNRVEAGDVYFCVNYGACDFPTINALQGQQRLSPVALTGTARLPSTESYLSRCASVAVSVMSLTATMSMS